MFLVSDTLKGRQALIRRYKGNNITLGVLLSVIDFEWTVRRAIIALGYQPTKIVRTKIERCSGAMAYKNAWKVHVYPYRKAHLASIVPDWVFLKDQVFILRHKIVHGVQVTADELEATERRDCALASSKALVDFALDCDVDLYDRLPVRYKAKELN